MSESPLISIIIPTFNRAMLVVETLQSVQNQQYKNWECLIIDDHSTDNTREVVLEFIKSDPRFSLHQRPDDRQPGGNAARNYGWELSKGDFINWFDSDDIMHPDHLLNHLTQHLRQPVDATINQAWVFSDSIDKPLRYWSAINPESDLLLEMIQTKTLWQTGCVLWNKKSLAARPFCEDLRSSQEWTFHIFQVLFGISYVVLPHTTAFIREHQGRIGKNISLGKVYSTFTSRKLVLRALRSENLLDTAKQAGLLRYIFLALRHATSLKYYGQMFHIVLFLIGSLFYLHHKKAIAKIIFIYFPIYFVTGKGEKLFRFPVNQ